VKFPLRWRLFGKVPEISPGELQRWLQEGRPVQVLDARTGLEYRQGTVHPEARHAPVTGMPEVMEQIELDRQIPVVVLCLSGHRSRPGTRWLREHGYEAYSLRGGVAAWRLAGYPLLKPKTER